MVWPLRIRETMPMGELYRAVVAFPLKVSALKPPATVEVTAKSEAHVVPVQESVDFRALQI